MLRISLPRSSTEQFRKDLHIETLRGLAIILVVAGHVIGSGSAGGMKVDDQSFLRYLYFSLEYIRLPLFTVISGWVYARKPVMPGQQFNFIRGKVRRLIIPMLVLSSLLFWFRWIFPFTNFKTELSNYGIIFLFPYDVYWYLYSLFLIFVVTSFLDQTRFFHNFKGWSAVLSIALVLFYVSGVLLETTRNYFSFKGAIYLFPFFLLGIAAFRFRNILLHPKAIVLYWVFFGLSIIVQQLSWFGYYHAFTRYTAEGVVIGFSGVLLLLNTKVKSSFLIYVGNYAYGIFLFHVFLAGAFRISLMKAGIENQFVILFVTTTLSVALCILIEKILAKSLALQLLFLGLVPKTQRQRAVDGQEKNIPTKEETVPIA